MLHLPGVGLASWPRLERHPGAHLPGRARRRADPRSQRPRVRPSRCPRPRCDRGHDRLVRGARQGALKEPTTSASGTPTSSSSSTRERHLRDAADARPPTAAATRTSAGTPRASARSARSSASTAWRTGTRGRSRSSGSGRSGRATTRPPRRARRGAARGRRDLRLRPLRAGARRRHLLDRHGAHARRRRRLHAPTAASTTSATATWPAWSRSSAAAPTSRARTATSSSPPTAGTRRYELVKNVVNSQNYVSEFALDDYPVAPSDILHTGTDAFDAALNTVNVGKFNLGFASIGICEHAFYEAITHAAQPRPLRQRGHRLPARPRSCSPTPTRGWSR